MSFFYPTPAASASFAADDRAAPLVWVLHDGKSGMRSQALGLAEATGFRFVEKPLDIRPPWSVLPPQLWPLPGYAIRRRSAQLAPPADEGSAKISPQAVRTARRYAKRAAFPTDLYWRKSAECGGPE